MPDKKIVKKKKLDKLLAKTDIGPRTAKKLHDANNTGDTADESKPPRRGGHGASRPQLPNFGDI